MVGGAVDVFRFLYSDLGLV